MQPAGVRHSLKGSAADAGTQEAQGSPTIAPDEFQIIKKGRLGGGRFADVFKGVWKGEEVAVKTFKHFDDSKLVQQQEEALIQSRLHHPNVLRLHGCCTDPETRSQCLIMEYMPKGSLRKVLDKEKLPWFTRERIALEIAEGLAYLHSNDVAHRDLKSLNVVLDDDYHAKVCDFGISTTREDAAIGSTIEAKGSHLWMAPEAFERREKSGEDLRKTDIYALGIIMWELCTQELPEMKSKHHSPDRFPDKGAYPPDFVNVAKNCCQEKPNERPTAQEVVDKLLQIPRNIQTRVFGEDMSTSHLQQGRIANCRHVAALYTLKKHPLAPSIIRGILTEKSSLDSEQEVEQDGWRVYFPFDNRPVDVNESDLQGRTIDEEEKKLLDVGEIGDKILLLAASRWRKRYGSSTSVDRGADTYIQAEDSRYPNEFFGLCLFDRIKKRINICAEDPANSLDTLGSEHIYSILDQFAAEPYMFLFTAGTPDSDDWEGMEHWDPAHMYSLLAANSSERTVTLVNPHETKTKEFTLNYECFIQRFRRLAGVKLSDAAGISPEGNDGIVHSELRLPTANVREGGVAQPANGGKTHPETKAVPVRDPEGVSSQQAKEIVDHLEEAVKQDAYPGVALATLGDYKQFLKEQLSIVKACYGEGSMEMAHAMDNVGSLLLSKKDSKGAKAYYEQALTIKEQFNDDSCVGLANSWENIGAALIGVGEPENAKESLKRALSVKQQHFGESHERTATTMKNLGEVFLALGDAQGARMYCEQAHAIQKRRNTPVIHRVKTARCLGAALMILGNVRAAKDWFDQCLAVQTPHYGAKHPESAGTARLLGVAFLNLGDAPRADGCLRRVLAVQKEYHGTTHVEVSRTLRALGFVLDSQALFGQSRQCFEQALVIQKEYYGTRHEEVARTFLNLGNLWWKSNSPRAAIEYFEKSLNVRKAYHGDNHESVADSLERLGKALAHVGNTQSSRECYQQASSIRKKIIC